MRATWLLLQTSSPAIKKSLGILRQGRNGCGALLSQAMLLEMGCLHAAPRPSLLSRPSMSSVVFPADSLNLSRALELRNIFETERKSPLYS